VGQHVVSLGESTVAELSHLLDDSRPVTYGGSREATYGNSFNYRVKDLAAEFLAQIRHLPYVVKEAPSERDVEIDRLREALAGGPRRG
jgi:hypothetical protein